ncbi:MAG: hypothetical protein JO269_07280 [Burkholderiaceae bacterium]|nr:hypothetical protein [Burkholderiaceae bacterium]
MNTIRTIESATLVSIGVFCASAMINIALHTNGFLAGETLQAVPAEQIQTITVSAKRLSAAEKAQALREQNALTDTLAVEHSGRVGVLHAG